MARIYSDRLRDHAFGVGRLGGAPRSGGEEDVKFAARLAGIAAIAGWIAYALYYVFSPQPPHSFAGDLGYSIVNVGRISALATSWHNVTDMVGWEPWNDFPSFLYAPGGQYVLAVPIGMLFGDPVRTVKLEQIVTLTLAFYGAALLYASAFGRTGWRWFAGFVYTAAPLSSMLVQWDTDFAWIVALAPWAPFAALYLGRRFGAAALPAAGIVCGVSTFAFSPEQGVTLGVPLLVLTMALYRREGIALPLLGIAGAFVALLAFPAFVVFPTRYGFHPMWWTPGTLAEFGSDTNGLRSLFAQGPLELIAFIYREHLVSENPLANVSGSLVYAAAAGAASLALVAYAFVAGGFRTTLRRWWPVAGLALACVVLACGTRLPFLGPFLWNGLIVKVPLLNALRTPDRFIQIIALLVALASAYGLQKGFQKAGGARLSVLVGALVVVIGYACFGVREGVIGFADIGRLPDFSTVNASAESIGGRTAVYAFPLNGSALDFAAYAPKTSTVEFTWNLMQRHVEGDGGVALLRRAAVNSVVTTPTWTQPSIDGMPGDMAEPVERSSFARPVYSGPSGARVFRIDGARPMASSQTPVCAIAGPAGFEIAAGEKFLDTAALVHGPRSGCARTILADADPLDVAIPASAIATWVGAELFGDLGFPAPNKFEIDRLQLAQPWYRDSYGGDSLIAGNPLITAASGSSNVVPFTISRPGRYSVWVRASGPATLAVRLGDNRSQRESSSRARGFRWIEFPLGSLQPGQQTLELSILRFVSLAQKLVIDEVAVAPSHVTLTNSPVDAVLVTQREFAPPIATDERAPIYLFPRLSGSAWSADVANVQVEPGTQIGFINGEPQIRPAQPHSRIRFRWDGPTGDYVASAVAWLAGSGSHDTVSSPSSSFESRYDVTLAPKPGDGRLHLRHGDPVDVTLTTGGGAGDALTQLVLLPIRTGMEPPTEYDQQSESWQFDADYSLAIIEAMHSPLVSMAAGSLRAPAGTSVEIPFHPDLTDGPVSVDLEFSGGSGRAALRCGSASDTVDVGAGTQNPGSADLVLKRTDASSCRLGITWLSGDFQFKFAHIKAAGSTLLGWTASQYFADGSYRWTPAGTHPAVLTVDGAPWKSGDSRHLSRGMHRLTIERGPAPLATLQFMRVGSWPLPNPASALVAERSSTAWTVRPAAPATLEIAELNDGNWFARGEKTEVSGYDCDLVNTCFDVGGPQDVSIGRRVPAALALGFLVSGLDVGIAILFLSAARATQRRRANGQSLRAK
jgi:hypothetical protein